MQPAGQAPRHVTPLLVARSLIFVLLQGAWTMFWAMLCFLFAPLPYNQRYYLTTRWSVVVIWLARHVCGIDYRVEGFGNLPDAPVILLSKHQSAWETIFYTFTMPRPLVFVFKRELLWIPFFGWGIGLLRMIAIDRKRSADAFDSVVRQGRQRLANGQWIIMFPEGTRIPVGVRSRYKTGGTRLAIQTGVPVVPIAMNAGHFWPRNSFIKYPGVVTVSIGAPIASSGESPDSLMTKVESWIESEMRRISPHVHADQA